MKEFNLNSIFNYLSSLAFKEIPITSPTPSPKVDEPAPQPEEKPTIIATPNLTPSAHILAKKVKVLLDNGHGVDTLGKGSPYSLNGVLPAIEFKEYKWAREIAQRIEKELKKRGYDVERIVTESTDIPLGVRANRANRIKSKCDTNGTKTILVSIHANAMGKGDKWYNNANGWCAYTSKGNTKADLLAECIYSAAEKIFIGRKVRKDMSDGDRDYEESFAMLTKTSMPAVLTENFFYTSETDLKYILSEQGKSDIVKVHVDGIIDYINKYC